MTNQEVFDLVIAHLRVQGSKSEKKVRYWERKQEEIVCAILGDDDRKDPLGSLLDNGEYDLEMEGYTVSSLIDLLPDRLLPHIELLEAITFLHDHAPTSAWEDGFASIASDFKLTFVSA
jgi:hypothetical protein